MSELRMENRRHAAASKALTWLYGGLCIARCNQTLEIHCWQRTRGKVWKWVLTQNESSWYPKWKCDGKTPAPCS